ncbi:MAG: hypothetical protein WDO19_32725 [Bacteroidota bacterium]
MATGILSDGFVMRIDLNDIGTIAAEAGRAILKIYNDPLEQFVFTRKKIIHRLRWRIKNRTV